MSVRSFAYCENHTAELHWNKVCNGGNRAAQYNGDAAFFQILRQITLIFLVFVHLPRSLPPVAVGAVLFSSAFRLVDQSKPPRSLLCASEAYSASLEDRYCTSNTDDEVHA